MNLKSLRMVFALGLAVMASHGWASVSLPNHTNSTWQDISSITWSTDNGNTWGNSTLAVGQSVEFKVTMHKTNIGNHFGDFVKVWIDWNGDETFSNSNEVILADYHIANASVKASNSPERSDGGYYDFFSGSFAVTNAMIGTHDLLARMTCSESLLNAAGQGGTWSDQWAVTYTTNDSAWYKNNFSPTVAYYQGEAELRKLTVTTGNSVPEPGTLALLATAMLGLGLRRKQDRQV